MFDHPDQHNSENNDQEEHNYDHDDTYSDNLVLVLVKERSVVSICSRCSRDCFCWNCFCDKPGKCFLNGIIVEPSRFTVRTHGIYYEDRIIFIFVIGGYGIFVKLIGESCVTGWHSNVFAGCQNDKAFVSRCNIDKWNRGFCSSINDIPCSVFAVLICQISTFNQSVWRLIKNNFGIIKFLFYFGKAFGNCKFAVIFCKIIIFSINLDDRSCIYQFFHINRNVVDMIIAGFRSNLDRDMRGLSRFKIFISGNGNG